MLNKDIPIEQLKKIKMLVLDSDGVTIPRGTTISQAWGPDFIDVQFKTKVITNELAKMIQSLKKKIKVCISSGRSLIYLQEMYAPIIGESTILQAENGNISLISCEVRQHFKYNSSYFAKIEKIKKRIRRLAISGFEPKQFILTVHSQKQLASVYRIVQEEDPEQELKIMWNGEAFDIQKKEITKGLGLRKIAEHTQISTGEMIAIGDRVNDKELIETARIGVSADQRALPAEYYTVGTALPGQQLVKYLLKKL